MELNMDLHSVASTESRSGSASAWVESRQLTAETAEEAASWLQNTSCSKWLDFGNGRRQLSGKSLLYLAKCGSHHIRIFHDESGRAVGIAGLQHVDSVDQRAMLWVVRPRLRPPVRMSAAEGAVKFLTAAFVEYGLKSVYAKIVESNRLSRALVESMGLKEVGRERAAHYMDDQFHDRVLYDILDSEFFDRYPEMATAMTTQV